jgi:hypothetical protein
MSTMILQNYTDLLKVEPGARSETCRSSRAGKQMIDIKVKEVTDTQVVEDPLLIMIPGVKAKHEVSSVCLFLCCFTDIHIWRCATEHSSSCL